MTTWAVSMVKDEADVIEGMLRHLAGEVDGILIADNGSTDGTRKLLDQLADELPAVIVIDDPNPAYEQSRKMTNLARTAVEDHGAAWIVPVDADEVWVASAGRIADVLAAEECSLVVAQLFNHIATAIDPAGDDPFRTMQWRQTHPADLPKVAIRWEHDAVISQGNHGAYLPSGWGVATETLEVRHFPYRTAEQMVRKARNGAAAYKAADLPETFGAHWRAYGEIIERHGEQALHDVFREHFWHLSPVDAGLVHDPAPYLRWQE